MALYLVPFLKYPAVPPGVSSPETVGERTGLYLTLLGASLVFAVVAVAVGQVLARRLGNRRASVVAALGFVLVVGAVMAALPAHEGSSLPLRDDGGNIAFPAFPADVLAGFRLYAIAAQAVLWSVLAMVFAPLAARFVSAPEGRPTDRQVNPPIYVTR